MSSLVVEPVCTLHALYCCLERSSRTVSRVQRLHIPSSSCLALLMQSYNLLALEGCHDWLLTCGASGGRYSSQRRAVCSLRHLCPSPYPPSLCSCSWLCLGATPFPRLLGQPNWAPPTASCPSPRPTHSSNRSASSYTLRKL